jgi:hypothetical protein
VQIWSTPGEENLKPKAVLSQGAFKGRFSVAAGFSLRLYRLESLGRGLTATRYYTVSCLQFSVFGEKQ